MRKLTAHLVEGIETSTNKRSIVVMDEPEFGSNNLYDVEGPPDANQVVAFHHLIKFQKGTIPEHGNNGVTIEELLAICADRLEGFQSGEAACKENKHAIDNIETALAWLHNRTRAREAAGTEGTDQP